MIGKTILHFTPWDKEVGLFDSNGQALSKKTDIRIQSNLLSNGVNKILEKLPSTEFIMSLAERLRTSGEARLLMTCIRKLWGTPNG